MAKNIDVDIFYSTFRRVSRSLFIQTLYQYKKNQIPVDRKHLKDETVYFSRGEVIGKMVREKYPERKEYYLPNKED